jgi:hypothetical protein
VYLHIQLQNLDNGGTSDPPVSQVRAAAMLLIVTKKFINPHLGGLK